jgi:hypothetical protein
LTSIRRNKAKRRAHARAHSTREAWEDMRPFRRNARKPCCRLREGCVRCIAPLARVASADAPQFGIEFIISHCNGPGGC